jgi:hypothetical protein
MIISTTVKNAMLNGEFNDGGKTYSLILLFDGSPSESDPETIDFTTSTTGTLQLTGSVFFAVLSGTTVIGVQVLDDDDNILIEEGVDDETFTANGTFTVNNIIVTIT